MEPDHTLELLRSMRGRQLPKPLERFGIPSVNSIGLSNSLIRSIAREKGKNHELSLLLWETGILEARILATLTGDPEKISSAQMDRWISQLNSWAECDAATGNLFRKTPFAYEKAMEWTYRKTEFEKRSGFSLVAALAVHDKKQDDKVFYPFLLRMEEEAWDERNFVKKAVNWALRQCGKRSITLYEKAVQTATRIRTQGSGSARWIASDALRELNNARVFERIQAKRRK